METITAAMQAMAPARPLTVHLLASEPRRTQALFEHAVNHPRGTTVQDILVLLYIHLEQGDLPSSTLIAPAVTEQTQKAEEDEASSSTASNLPQPVLLVALQAQVYTLPATSSTVIYIAKADSSSYPLPAALSRKPYARTLISAFLAHYITPATRPTARTFVQLFARSQAQYLFPDSGDNAGKRVLTGEKLCRWWKAALEEAVARSRSGVSSEEDNLQLSYVLPGMAKYEASLMVGPTTDAYPWSYGMRDLPPMFPPSSLPTGALPADGTLPAQTEQDGVSLGEIVPTFEDDPRTRFLTDLALPPGAAPTPLSASSSGGVSKPRLAADAEDDDGSGGTTQEPSIKARHSALKASASMARREKASARLAKTTEEAFWELLAFRQECSLGQTVGFFSLYSASPAAPAAAAAPADLVSTRSALLPASTLERKAAGLLPKQLWLRVIATLLNQSFATPPLIVRGSRTVWDLTQTLLEELGILGVVERRIEASAQPTFLEKASEKRKAGEEAAVPAEQSLPKKLMAVRKKRKPVE
jgi:regulator of Ty1 transposition protein 109